MTETPFEILIPAAESAEQGGPPPLLFLCDHASNALPAPYGSLGLEPALFATHIASDIGAALVTRALAKAYGAPAILARYSRLLIDLNRGPDDPTLVMKLSDGSIIPGNRDADAGEIARRLELYHEPYHRAVEELIALEMARAAVPVLISMHSFTPVWKGWQRPWEIGILYDRDRRLSDVLMLRLREAGVSVGDNEPYSGELENDTMYRHGTMRGLPHVLIEIRQDIVATEAMALAFASRLKPVLDAALADLGKPALYFTRPLSKEGEFGMDEATREKIEAAAFRRLVAHLRGRTDVQNIDLMTVGGFCRNCLGDWYREAAAEKGIALEKDAAREIVYGMPPGEWKTKYQKETTPVQQAAFAAAQKTHS